jgi:Ca2+-binding RTX toxin-like protein
MATPTGGKEASMKKLFVMALGVGALLAVTVPGSAMPVAAAGKVTCQGQVATIVGTKGHDVIYGTNGPDVIAGLGGNDVINGLAIAYSDIDGLDGYSSGDVMIAKLVDTNGDDVVSVGDTIRMGRYPTDFGATAFGDWGVKSHIVTSLGTVDATAVRVYSAEGIHEWVKTPGYEYSWQLATTHATEFQDGFEPPCYLDQLVVDPASPSEPTTAVGGMGTNRPGDQDWVEGELHF